jgi:hypothetical protein
MVKKQQMRWTGRGASFTAGPDVRFELGVALDAIVGMHGAGYLRCDCGIVPLFPSLPLVYALILIFRLAGFDLGVI